MVVVVGRWRSRRDNLMVQCSYMVAREITIHNSHTSNCSHMTVTHQIVVTHIQFNHNYYDSHT